MTKEKFILYISVNNPGFYKTRKSHIKNAAPNILDEIDLFINDNNLEPINFNDGIKYYLSDNKNQQKCICGKKIKINTVFCSKKCAKENINITLSKTRETLKFRYNADSPLKIKKFKDKFDSTCIERYGGHPSSNKEIKKKIKDSNIESYKNIELRKTLGKSISNAYKKNSASIINKRKETNFEKYNEFTILTTNAISKAKKTLQTKYNTTNPFAIHENTYELAKLGSIKFFGNELNKNNSIKKRIVTIKSKYGSLENMNKQVFLKKKEKILESLQDIGFADEILDYNYNKLGFITCKCDKNHEYDISFKLLRDRMKRNDICCTKCSPPISKWVSSAQIEIYNWLSTYIECEQNNRKLLNGKEIDIFIPSKNIGIEFNGIYWHSDLFKDKNYHLNKTLFLKDKNIKLIHIWEDLWENKKDIIKGRILSNLNINQTNIGARKCELKEISSKEINLFYEENHLQGKTKGSKHIALFYNNEIISALSIGKRKIGKNVQDRFELLRFCNKVGINCMGSFSKLFKYIKTHHKGKYVSYADLCWGEGNVYEKAGFELKEYSKPNYWYFVENKRYHRYTFNKQRLVKLGYDKNKTEFQIMNDIKALRIYDCGNAVWTLDI